MVLNFFCFGAFNSNSVKLLGLCLVLKKIYSHIFLIGYKNTLIFYSLCCCIYVSSCICVSSFRSFTVFPVSRLITAFYAEIPALCANIPCYLGFYMRYHTRCATGRGWRGTLGGVEASFFLYLFLIGRKVYPANLIPNYGYQTGSRSRRGLGSQAQQIINE